ncbi:NUDIX domain-containing protein [Heliorestis convoluta]|uniref:NUDIX hydrolase n=1 Tax=Heliorestis convoluta TaxID=356322 RepID=A0A5Q2N156_9FIRM|nr:NUDIX hydrolase [Heliorestis convoluta]QGG47533.1 NUDIX hydrolase [Heliorestis convoluta]
MFRHRMRAAAILVNAQKQVLLIHHRHPRRQYHWLSPPGGGVEKGETIFEAAEREMLEECNLHCKAQKLLYVVEWLDEVRKIHHLELYIQVQYLAGTLQKGRDPEVDEKDQMIFDCFFMTEKEIRAAILPVYPTILRNQFWQDYERNFQNHQVYLGREVEEL